jgi:2-polyprenyl-3-methyl-5-hydroxy-6-metoxy-1,4-benzoquinol methylase
MGSIKDDRGFNQGYKPSVSLSARTERRCNYIENKINNANKSTADVLEIGCGTGKMAFLIAKKTGFNVLGIDLCLPFIEQSKHNYHLPNLDFLVLDFNNPDKLCGRKFDYIIGDGILHHLYYNIDESLLNIKKLLKENGKIVFLEPNLLNPYCYLIFNTTPFFRKRARLEPTEKAFSKQFIKKNLTAAGYKNVKVEYKDFLLPGIPNILIKPSIIISNILEGIPLLKCISQSIFISANN